MGMLGNGNFEQDGALNFVWQEVQKPLIQKVQSVVVKPVLAEADEPDSGPIVAAVEILALLSEHVNAAPPKPDLVALWKATFLNSWDHTASDVIFRPEDVIERRSVITATFDRLERLSHRFHQQDAEQSNEG